MDENTNPCYIDMEFLNPGVWLYNFTIDLMRDRGKDLKPQSIIRIMTGFLNLQKPKIPISYIPKSQIYRVINSKRKLRKYTNLEELCKAEYSNVQVLELDKIIRGNAKYAIKRLTDDNFRKGFFFESLMITAKGLYEDVETFVFRLDEFMADEQNIFAENEIIMEHESPEQNNDTEHFRQNDILVALYTRETSLHIQSSSEETMKSEITSDIRDRLSPISEEAINYELFNQFLYEICVNCKSYDDFVQYTNVMELAATRISNLNIPQNNSIIERQLTEIIVQNTWRQVQACYTFDTRNRSRLTDLAEIQVTHTNPVTILRQFTLDRMKLQKKQSFDTQTVQNTMTHYANLEKPVVPFTYLTGFLMHKLFPDLFTFVKYTNIIHLLKEVHGLNINAVTEHVTEWYNDLKKHPQLVVEKFPRLKINAKYLFVLECKKTSVSPEMLESEIYRQLRTPSFMTHLLPAFPEGVTSSSVDLPASFIETQAVHISPYTSMINNNIGNRGNENLENDQETHLCVGKPSNSIKEQIETLQSANKVPEDVELLLTADTQAVRSVHISPISMGKNNIGNLGNHNLEEDEEPHLCVGESSNSIKEQIEILQSANKVPQDVELPLTADTQAVRSVHISQASMVNNNIGNLGNDNLEKDEEPHLRVEKSSNGIKEQIETFQSADKVLEDIEIPLAADIQAVRSVHISPNISMDNNNIGNGGNGNLENDEDPHLYTRVASISNREQMDTLQSADKIVEAVEHQLKKTELNIINHNLAKQSNVPSEALLSLHTLQQADTNKIIKDSLLHHDSNSPNIFSDESPIEPLFLPNVTASSSTLNVQQNLMNLDWPEKSSSMNILKTTITSVSAPAQSQSQPVTFEAEIRTLSHTEVLTKPSICSSGSEKMMHQNELDITKRQINELAIQTSGYELQTKRFGDDIEKLFEKILENIKAILSPNELAVLSQFINQKSKEYIYQYIKRLFEPNVLHLNYDSTENDGSIELNATQLNLESQPIIKTEHHSQYSSFSDDIEIIPNVSEIIEVEDSMTVSQLLATQAEQIHNRNQCYDLMEELQLNRSTNAEDGLLQRIDEVLEHQTCSDDQLVSQHLELSYNELIKLPNNMSHKRGNRKRKAVSGNQNNAISSTKIKTVDDSNLPHCKTHNEQLTTASQLLNCQMSLFLDSQLTNSNQIPATQPKISLPSTVRKSTNNSHNKETNFAKRAKLMDYDITIKSLHNFKLINVKFLKQFYIQNRNKYIFSQNIHGNEDQLSATLYAKHDRFTIRNQLLYKMLNLSKRQEQAFKTLLNLYEAYEYKFNTNYDCDFSLLILHLYFRTLPSISQNAIILNVHSKDVENLYDRSEYLKYKYGLNAFNDTKLNELYHNVIDY